MNNKNTMAEVEKFKSAIVKIRDILRSCAVTGMDSMRHICLYMLVPYLTLNNVKELGIPEEFAWENRSNLIKGDEDISLEKFEQDLIPHFDRLFGTQKFTFEVKNGVKHKEILEILNTINMQHVDLHMDVLGYIYEQHLKTGSSSSRDLGQFFTDRFICEYMVKLCNPKFKYDSVPESVCDPTMGTGGFLTAYLKYFKNVDWSVHQTQIHGVEHESKVAGVCRLNMFIESKGQIFKHLQTADSLHGGLDPTTYDIILANMPFGLKGLTYAGCHESFRKKINISGTKSEPLFLQLMMVSLNERGRCAVVVPDGMLVNNSKCHNGTRKYLLENFELKRVIKMKGKFFMNTGIQPSIIFFENSGKKTEQVEFWDVERDDKGNISEKMVISVPVEDFDETYSLDMRKYEESETVTYNEEIPMVTLGDICIGENGKTLNSSSKEDGPYKIMGGGTDYNGNHSQYNRDEMVLSISKSGTAGHVKWHTQKFWAGDCFTLTAKDTSQLLNKYLYYYLKLNNDLVKAKNTGSTIPHCKWDDVKYLELPLPSLEIQDQIVEELDAIYESKKNASDMIENLKKQMKSIINTLKYQNYEQNLIKDIGSLCRNNSEIIDSDSGEYNKYFGPKIVGKCSNYHFDGEYILTPNRQTIGIFGYLNEKFTTTHTFVYKVNVGYNAKFIYYYLTFDSKLNEKSRGVIPFIRNEDFLLLGVVVPPLEVQEELVKRLDVLSEQIECLEKIETQSDNNAKFVLNGYLGV